jgi:hypothetical protein
VMEVLNELGTTIRVVGPVTQPRLIFDVKGLTKEFQDALVAAGKERVKQEIDSKLQEQLGGKIDEKVPEELKKPAEDLMKGLGGLLGGKKEEDK